MATLFLTAMTPSASSVRRSVHCTIRDAGVFAQPGVVPDRTLGKLVRHHYANQMDELYNLKSDPGETRNLYGNAAHRPIRDQLQERLTAWMRSIDDPILHGRR